jgi:hypothetical protein
MPRGADEGIAIKRKLVWRLNLKPGEKRELPLKFSVEYPGGTPVTGVE